MSWSWRRGFCGFNAEKQSGREAELRLRGRGEELEL